MKLNLDKQWYDRNIEAEENYEILNGKIKVNIFFEQYQETIFKTTNPYTLPTPFEKFEAILKEFI